MTTGDRPPLVPRSAGSDATSHARSSGVVTLLPAGEDALLLEAAGLDEVLALDEEF